MSEFQFRDLGERTWIVPELKLGHIMKLNRETGIELNDIIKEGHLWNSTDQALLCVGAALWQLCNGQHECTEDEFFESFDGEVFANAQMAFAERVANFIPPAKRVPLRKMAIAQRAMQETTLRLTDRQIQELDQAIEEALAKLDEASSKNAGSEPEKQESATRETSASES